MEQQQQPATMQAPDGYVLKKANPFNAKWFGIGLMTGLVAPLLLWWLIFDVLAHWLSGG